MKTAVILILVLIVLSILGSFIPQGRELTFYTDEYGDLVGNLIIAAHFYNFFRSWLFLIFSSLFFINLATCSILRLHRRIRRKAPLRLGPDIIHLSLLLIIVLGVFVLFTRQETMVMLEAEDSFFLPDGTEISLVVFEIEYYEDGRPADWVSRILVKSGDKSQEYSLEVNKPFQHGSYRIFQSAFDLKPHAIIRDDDHDHELNRRDGLPVDEGALYLMDIHDIEGEAYGTFFLTKDSNSQDYEELVLKSGDSFHGYFVDDLFITKTTGLQIVYQPGNTLILAALLLFCVGLAVTFYQKIGDGIA